MYKIGDVVEIFLEGNLYTAYKEWHGLVGIVEKVFGIQQVLRIRFPDAVPDARLVDEYILQLSPEHIRLVSPRIPDWEV